MDFGRALSAALLFIITLSTLGISQNVPDGVVYTEVKKTLVTGTKGVLTCRFKGVPLAVYWKRGSDPVNSPSIITWGYGNKYGPRYDDGSCDIDENYSLIIKNVTFEDEGRYICRVSNYKAILIHNYTDVTITNIAVKTDQSILVQKGEVGVLPCEVNIRPSTVSWVRGYNETLVTVDLSRNVIERGELGQFNITNDYSLVIYDIAVQHEDEYLCEVADYDTGKTYRDATLLNVFAYPREPFPSIKECPVTSSSSCTLRIQSDTTVTMLTCQVEGYYPQIDLYFVRGAELVETLEAREWNNSDGTLNKRIEIEADGTGETSFECVATGLVGQDDSGSMTIHLVPDNKQSRVVVAVVVPAAVIFVSAIIVIAVLVFKRRKALWKQEYERVRMEPTQKDLISYIEIWMLVKYAVQQKVSKNLANVLDLLLGYEAESGTLHTEEEYYKEICRWKKEYTGVSQRKDFFDACWRQGLKPALDQLQRYSDSQKELTSDDLEHTLWHVVERERITELLKELGAPPVKMDRLQNKSMKDVIVGAMNVLKSFLAEDVNSSRNQEVMLSIALETINYSPNDHDFFRITDEQKRDLDRQEIQTLLPTKVTSRHCSELVDAMMKLKEEYPVDMTFFEPERKDVWFDEVIETNRTDMFDSHQMIEDWWAEQNCSNYQKRCRLRKAVDGLQDQVNLEASGEKWPSTKKIKQIVTLVPQSQLMRLWKALHISYDSDDLMYEEKRLEKMLKWRDGLIKKNQEDKYNILATALKSIGFDGLLSRPKNRAFIYKAELLDMALDLIMEDFRPFAHALGIKETRLTSYKRAFHPSHLERGTVGLVLHLARVTKSVSYNTIRRPPVCNILNKAGYRNVASRFMFASEPSYSELFALEAALAQGEKRKSDVPHETADMKPPGKSNKSVAPDTKQSPSTATKESQSDGKIMVHGNPQEPPRSEATLSSADGEKTHAKYVKNTEGSCEKSVDVLQRVLGLTDEDIPESGINPVLMMFKIWKERVCPSLIDQRVVLAEGVKKIGRAHLVPGIINGEYHSNETSIEFIENMLKGLDEDQRSTLEGLLKEADKGTWPKNSSSMPQDICTWIAQWTKEMSKKHRDFNDELVNKGFLDLAREIMNIEQYR